MTRVLVVPPGATPYVQEIDANRQGELQKIVGGWLELLWMDDRAHCYGNEEGDGLPVNETGTFLLSASPTVVPPGTPVRGTVAVLGQTPDGDEADVPDGFLDQMVEWGFMLPPEDIRRPGQALERMRQAKLGGGHTRVIPFPVIPWRWRTRGILSQDRGLDEIRETLNLHPRVGGAGQAMMSREEVFEAILKLRPADGAATTEQRVESFVRTLKDPVVQAAYRERYAKWELDRITRGTDRG